MVGVMTRHGRHSPDRKRLTVSGLPNELQEALRVKATSEGRTVAEVIREQVAEYLSDLRVVHEEDAATGVKRRILQTNEGHVLKVEDLRRTDHA